MIRKKAFKKHILGALQYLSVKNTDRDDSLPLANDAVWQKPFGLSKITYKMQYILNSCILCICSPGNIAF